MERNEKKNVSKHLQEQFSIQTYEPLISGERKIFDHLSCAHIDGNVQYVCGGGGFRAARWIQTN